MSFALREDLLPQPGSTIAGQYRVEKLLGHGGMGAVFAGSHLRTGRAIAIKWMLPQAAASKEAVQRFIAEARATARIEHPNVVHIYDFGEDEGSPFLVMERLRGESLRERLDRVGRLTPADAMKVMLPAMRGVAEAHREAIIHRDLKPDNIFLCRGKDGTEREAKVVDFGISKLYDDDAKSNLTGTGMMMGTPAYMSPEQLNAPKDADARFDVYALGVVFYETLTGRLPYDAEGIFQLVAQIMSADPFPIRQLAPDVPADLEAAVLRAMHRDVDARFATMEEMIAAVEAARRRMLGSSPGVDPMRPASSPPPAMPPTNAGTGPLAAESAPHAIGFAPTGAVLTPPQHDAATPPPRAIPPTALGTPTPRPLHKTAVLPEGLAADASTPEVDPTMDLPALSGSQPGVVGAAGTPFEAFGPPKKKGGAGKVIAIGAVALLLGVATAGGVLLYVLPKADEGRAAASAPAATDSEPDVAAAVAPPDDSTAVAAPPTPDAPTAVAASPTEEPLPDGGEAPVEPAEAAEPPAAEPEPEPRDRPRRRGDRRRARRPAAPPPVPEPQPLVRPAPEPVVTRPPPRPRTEQGANGAMIIE